MKISEVVKRNKQKLADRLKRTLRRGPVTLEELSSRYDRGVEQVRAAIEELREHGFNCQIKAGAAEILRDMRAGGVHRIDKKLLNGRSYLFGVVSDTHLGSKYSRLDALNAIYDRFQAEGVKDVYHGGNLIDGQSRFNRFDLVPGADSFEGQLKIAAHDYPKRKGLTTHFICGDDHEGWYAQREGINVGQVMQDRFAQAGRTDLHYLSYLEADILIPSAEGRAWIRLMHPGGGTAYATSYNLQKICESFQGGEKPDMVLVAHYHKADFEPTRDVLGFQTGCVQDQTPFMRKKRLQAHVGAWLIETTQTARGHFSRVKQEWMRFYDRGFYTGEKYPRW